MSLRIGRDAGFCNEAAADFRLASDSPAIDAGGPLALTEPQLALLHARSTTGVGSDMDPLGLGFHF